MPIQIVIPRLGWSMEEGAFVAWLKKDGDEVRGGDRLFSIEGDKAIQEIESIDSGILRIAPGSPQPGEPVRVGQLIGHLLSAEEAGLDIQAPSAIQTVPASARAEISKPLISAPSPTQSEALINPAPRRRERAVSPRARRLAAELGVDWSRLNGSGRTGRIREADIRAASSRVN